MFSFFLYKISTIFVDLEFEINYIKTWPEISLVLSNIDNFCRESVLVKQQHNAFISTDLLYSISCISMGRTKLLESFSKDFCHYGYIPLY